MGNIRRIKKQLAKQPIAMADTKLVFNKCRVYLGHPNPRIAGESARKFALFMKSTMARAAIFNIRDLYEAHFQVLQKIERGEDLVKEEVAKN